MPQPLNGIEFTDQMRRRGCAGMLVHFKELQHIDLDRVAIVYDQTRFGPIWGARQRKMGLIESECEESLPAVERRRAQ